MPPGAGRVALFRSAKILSCSSADWPTTRAASRSITAPTPGAPKPSSYSLQPTMPLSVVTLTKW